MVLYEYIETFIYLLIFGYVMAQRAIPDNRKWTTIYMRNETKDMLDFEKPETLTQWLIFLAAIGITLSSPAGTRAFIKELNKYIFEEQGERGKQYESQQLSQALYHLKKRKAVRVRKVDGKTLIELTEKGKKRKLEYDIERLRVPGQVRWDGKWRMVMFDISEDKKVAREALRGKLRQLGFVQFQKSVWIYPYPCEDEIDFITEFFSIAKYVNLITVKIEKDKPLRAKFNLV